MLVNMKINEFFDLLASDAPAPGGGSASALAGSVGICLTIMVASLTAGKEKYKEFEPIIQEILKEAGELQTALTKAIDEDTEAYNTVSDAYKMPKSTDGEKEVRTAAIQEALKTAAGTPFRMMELAHSALLCTEKAVGKSNPNVLSDLGVAAINLKSCVQGAWLNVLINIGSIKDEPFVTQMKEKGAFIYNQTVSLADRLYIDILKSLYSRLN